MVNIKKLDKPQVIEFKITHKTTMAKIKLDDKEYDTENFSKEALASLNSLQFVRSELARFNASIAVCKTAEAAYINALKDQISD